MGRNQPKPIKAGKDDIMDIKNIGIYRGNPLIMGATVIGVDMAKDVVTTWLKTEFEGGRHQVRVSMIEN